MNYFPETLPLRLCLITFMYKTRWLSGFLFLVSCCVLIKLSFCFDENPSNLREAFNFEFYGSLTFEVISFIFAFPTLVWSFICWFSLDSKTHRHADFEWPRGLEPVLLYDKLLYMSELIDLGRISPPRPTDNNSLIDFMSSIQIELRKTTTEAEKIILKLNEAPTADFNSIQESLVTARNSQRELTQKLQTIEELNSTSSRELEQLNQALPSLSLKLTQEEVKCNAALKTKRKTQREIRRLTEEINAKSAETNRLLTESKSKHEEALQRKQELQSKLDKLQRQNRIVMQELGVTESDLQAARAKLHDLDRQVAAAAREKAEKRNDVRKQGEIIEIMEEEVEEVRQGIQSTVEKYRKLCSRENQLLNEGMALVKLSVASQTAQTGDTCKLGECSLCMAKDIDCVLVSCGHICCCSDCAHSLCRDYFPACPICRKRIERVQKCYST